MDGKDVSVIATNLQTLIENHRSIKTVVFPLVSTDIQLIDLTQWISSVNGFTENLYSEILNCIHYKKINK